MSTLPSGNPRTTMNRSTPLTAAIGIPTFLVALVTIIELAKVGA